MHHWRSPTSIPKRYNRRNTRRGRNGNSSRGPSRFPRTVLKRTFRQSLTIALNNTSGGGLQQYAYYSKYFRPTPAECTGFKDAQQTFEFWRLKKFRLRAQPGYNSYNQSYNTINLDALAALQIWTASDPSLNENISGVSIKAYNNAKVHTLSLNGIKTLVNTPCRVNQLGSIPLTILPPSTWLDTSTDQDTNQYSGFQFFAQMNGISGVDYVPTLQLILEYDVEFKQPAYQNRPDGFESDIVGSTLTTIPDPTTPEVTRDYECVSYSINGTGNNYRFERVDGLAGSLDYTLAEMYTVYVNQTSGKYFSDRKIIWTGPEPRKPPPDTVIMSTNYTNLN